MSRLQEDTLVEVLFPFMKHHETFILTKNVGYEDIVMIICEEVDVDDRSAVSATPCVPWTRLVGARCCSASRRRMDSCWQTCNRTTVCPSTCARRGGSENASPIWRCA